MTDLHIETGPEPRLAICLKHWRAEARCGEFLTPRYRCRYFVWGNGPPLVFIHGLCDRAVSFVPMMHALRDRFQCVGYELPDGVDDGARIERIRFDNLVADLFALLDQLRIRQAYTFRSSFGSTIALADGSGSVQTEYLPAGSSCPSNVTFVDASNVVQSSAPGHQTRPYGTSLPNNSRPLATGRL